MLEAVKGHPEDSPVSCLSVRGMSSDLQSPSSCEKLQPGWPFGKTSPDITADAPWEQASKDGLDLDDAAPQLRPGAAPWGPHPHPRTLKPFPQYA